MMIEAATIQETTMDLPVKFPSETEVILEDVARFRALSPRSAFRRSGACWPPASI